MPTPRAIHTRASASLCKLLLLALLLTGSAAASAGPAACPPSALNVLLTNDDGYDTPGITALHEALLQAGHRVKRVAPAENQSGSSTSVAFRDVTVTQVSDQRFDHVYAVNATPATAVILGATALFSADEPVDLVVSGINEGANLGPATPISGTVGAVISGLRLLQPQVPGIAVSTNLVGRNAAAPENLELNRRISTFITRLITRLQADNCGNRRVLADGLALNVNYPPGDIKGVRLAEQGQAPYFRLAFQALEGGIYVPTFGAAESMPDVAGADTVLFNAGYVTIVPIDGNYTAPLVRSRSPLDALETLAP